jgi:hypothetical protein
VVHRRDLADDVHAVPMDCFKRPRGVEHFQHNGRAAPEQGRHQRFRLPADMRWREVHQQPGALSEAEGRTQAHVLAGDVAVRKQGRLGAAGGTGGEDRLRRVLLLHGGHRRLAFALRYGWSTGCQVRE